MTLLTLLMAQMWLNQVPQEAPLVPHAIPLEESGRYQSPRSYDETIEYYQRYFKKIGGVRFRDIVNLPGIKAKHLKCLSNQTNWEGINIYETKGEVRFFVLSRKEKITTKKNS